MDLLHLTYFVEVARQKSFTKAAKTLHVSQPAISKVIKTLEGELDTLLFERSGRTVKLTDTGHAILERAQSILDDMDQFSSDIADITGLKRGHITIGLPPMVGARFFPQVIGTLKQDYPEITIQLIEVGSKEVEAGIDQENLDLGVVALPVNSDHFEMFSFLNEPLRVVMSPDHALAEKTAIDLSDLKQESFILYRDDFSLNDLIRLQCEAHGFYPTVVLQSSQWDFIVEMVSAHFGIALLPDTICRSLDPQRFSCRPLKEITIPWNLALIWKKGKYLSFAARKLVSVTKQYFAAEHTSSPPFR